MVVFLELPGVGSIWIERTGHMPLRYVGRLRFKNSKKRFSNLNFGSFFWGTTFGHFGPFWAIFWWHVVKSSHRNAPKNYQRTKYPFEGETPHVAKRPTALRPCGIVADRENKIVAGVAKKGHPCQSRKTVSTLGCLFGSSQRYKAKCLKEQKNLNMT